MGTNYNPPIVTDGLVFCVDAANQRSYPKSGTTWSDLVGANNGTLTNGPTFNAGNGGGIVFDGSNDQVIGTNSELLSFGDGSSDSPFSLSCWVYLNVNAPSSALPLISKYRSYDPFRGEYNFSVISGNKLMIQCLDGTTTIRCRRQSVDSLSANRWYNLASTYNGNSSDSGFVLYLNGEVLQSSAFGQDGSYVAMQRASDPSELTIGAVLDEGATSFQGYLNGKVSQVSVYNRALSADEIRQNYQATVGRYS